MRRKWDLFSALGVLGMGLLLIASACAPQVESKTQAAQGTPPSTAPGAEEDLSGAAPIEAGAVGETGETGETGTADTPEVITVADTGDMDPDLRAMLEDFVGRAQKNPERADRHAELGITYEANTMWLEAERCYANAAQLAPEQPQWRYRQAIVMHKNGRLGEASVIMRGVSSELEKSAAAHYRLGDMLLDLGELDEAESAFQRALDISPEFPEVYVGLGRAKFFKEQFEQALELFQKSLAIDGSNREAHYALGLCLQALGQKDAAKRELALGQGALKRFPPDSHTALLAGYAAGYFRRMGQVEDYLRTGRIPEAMERLAKLEAERPQDHFVLNLIARAHTMRGDLPKTLQYLLRSAEANPSFYQTFNDLCVCMLNLQRNQEGLEYAEKAVELAPDIGSTHYYQGLALMRLRRSDEAYQAMKLAQERGCTEPQMYSYLSQLASFFKLMPEGLRYARIAAEKMPDDPEAHLMVAKSSMAVGRSDAALEALNRAKALAPHDPQVKRVEAALQQAIKNRQQANPGPGEGGR